MLGQGSRRRQGVGSAGPYGDDAVVRLDHVSGAAHQIRVLLVADQEQRFEMPQGAVGAPVFGQLHDGPGQVAVVFVELLLEPGKKRKGVGRTAGEPGQDLVVEQALDFPGLCLDDAFSNGDLAVAYDSQTTSAANTENGRAARRRSFSHRVSSGPL